MPVEGGRSGRRWLSGANPNLWAASA